LAPLNDLDGLLGELIAQQLPPGPAVIVRAMGVRAFGRSVRRAVEGQGWALEQGGKARVDAEWLATVMKTLDGQRDELRNTDDLAPRAEAWRRLARAVESKNRGQG